MNDYKMPHVYQGQTVLWYQGGSKLPEHACPALVIKVSPASLLLKVFGEDRDFRVECVRHISDPFARESERISDGGWDYLERNKSEVKAEK